MLDLKAKLAAAGLVTKEQIAAAERKDGKKGQGPRDGKASRPPAPPRSGLDLPALQRASKSELYEAVRRVVDRARLDPTGGLPGERAEAFHFTTPGGQLGRLTLEPEIRDQLVDGRAGIIAFMGHHGLAHAVVPRSVAEDVFALVPDWLRVLKDHPGAGQTRSAAPASTPAGREKNRDSG